MNKSEILTLVNKKLTEKSEKLQALIDETRASNNDTKSSMGDKYEIGREMLQQEINNLQIQLNEVLKQQDFLKIFSTKPSEKVEKGALVETDKGLFYISVSLSNIFFDDKKIFCISPDSPLAKALEGKSKSEIINLNNVTHTIKEIF